MLILKAVSLGQLHGYGVLLRIGQISGGTLTGTADFLAMARELGLLDVPAHAIIDIGHAEGWLSHVIEAQVREFPDSRVGIAEGLLARADASLDYFDYCLSGCQTR